ncbi:hypothetical protein TGRH88_003910 [Toxoplasma gondii]|uniref:Uncharacterized protein n=1 Tax=Toxoplasma gondii TaxID=5811 RepID=A0A7J6KDX0_TOXGO|nr:hypothetical protein TGRH88_003910 [Toxoplasma gondii]
MEHTRDECKRVHLCLDSLTRLPSQNSQKLIFVLRNTKPDVEEGKQFAPGSGKRWNVLPSDSRCGFSSASSTPQKTRQRRSPFSLLPSNAERML